MRPPIKGLEETIKAVKEEVAYIAYQPKLPHGFLRDSVKKIHDHGSAITEMIMAFIESDDRNYIPELDNMCWDHNIFPANLDDGLVPFIMDTNRRIDSLVKTCNRNGIKFKTEI